VESCDRLVWWAPGVGHVFWLGTLPGDVRRWSRLLAACSASGPGRKVPALRLADRIVVWAAWCWSRGTGPTGGGTGGHALAGIGLRPCWHVAWPTAVVVPADPCGRTSTGTGDYVCRASWPTQNRWGVSRYGSVAIGGARPTCYGGLQIWTSCWAFVSAGCFLVCRSAARPFGLAVV